MFDIIVDETELPFNRLKTEIYAFDCKVTREMLKYALEVIDKNLHKKEINLFIG